MFKRALAVLSAAFALAAVPAGAADGGFEASFSVSRQQATIGDDIVVAADIVHDDAFRIEDLPKDLKLPPFVVKKIERVAPKKAKGVTAEGFRVTLTVFETGRYTVPPIAIRFKDPKGKSGVVYTEKWTVDVFSVLGQEGSKGPEDIRPLKDPESLETSAQRRLRWILWTLGGLALAFLTLAGWLGWRRYQAWLEERKPAHQRALEALDRLEKQQFIVSGQPKLYYEGLSDILKTYLHRRYAAGSPDLTTREYLSAIEAHPQASGAADAAKEVLVAADLVKFARDLPTQEEARSKAERVRQMVLATAPTPPAAKGKR